MPDKNIATVTVDTTPSGTDKLLGVQAADSTTKLYQVDSLPIAQAQVSNLTTDLAGKAAVGHTHASSDVSDFAEAVDDRLNALVVVTAPLTKAYDDMANTLTLASAAATTTTQGDMSAADKSKLDGVAAGATANDTDANLKNRANHTGSQTLATISDAGTAASKNVPATGNAAAGEVVLGSDTRLSDARPPTAHTHPASEVSDFAEAVDDRVAALVVAGANITKTYDDVANTLTIAATMDSEAIDDRVAALLTAGTNVTLTYDDVAGTLTIASTVPNETIDDRVAALLVAGANITLTYDDVANTLTIAAAGGGSITVQEEGTALTSRSAINFIGAAVTAADDATNTRTNVTVSALVPANNLSDVAAVATARTNLGLGDAATKNTGTAAGTVAAGDHAHALDGLSDVTITTPADGHVLTFDSVDSTWKNEAAAAGGGELGYVQITASVSTSSTTQVDLTGLSVTVTLTSRPVKITFYLPSQGHSGSVPNTRSQFTIHDVTAGSQLQSALVQRATGTASASVSMSVRHQPGAGSRTYKVQFGSIDAGTTTANATATAPAFLLVEEL